MRFSSFLIVFSILGAVVIPSAPAAAQSDSTLTGTVVDSSGGAVGGADVTLRPRTGPELRTTTDRTGHFAFDHVAPGPVSVTAHLGQFRPATIEAPKPGVEILLVLDPMPVAEEVVVTAAPNRIQAATRTDTALRDVPQAISVVSRDTMKDLNMTGIGDVVRYVPGVGYAQGEGNRDTPVFRGNSSTADFYVDGIRDDLQYYRDVYNLDRVEVLKGPNAMIFGRGGAGGIINRVQRAADWASPREVSLQLGSFDNRRISADFGSAANSTLAGRITGVYENTRSYRDGVMLERYGVNPTIALALANTMVRAGFEYFHDGRTADRGVPSFQGRPIATDASTFFGDPDHSHSSATVKVLTGLAERRFGNGTTLRNRTSYGDYDKFYQNIFPGAVTSTGTMVSIAGYNNATVRRNFFNQTDLTIAHRTGRFDHTILMGLELGRQETDNFRKTAYFTSVGPTATTLTLPVSNPTTSVAPVFRQSSTDADNHGVATVAALFAQDQIVLSRHVQAVIGIRFDRFDVDFHNNRIDTDLGSHDAPLSPRLGLIYKPATPVSIYGSYSLSFQPRAGDQLTSLSLSNHTLEPETFRNYEAGAKWDFGSDGAFTIAVYDLQRGNVVIPDPNDPTVSQLADAQRTRGVELGLGGHMTERWSVLGAYAYQDGKITRALSASVPAGAVLANLPASSVSLWNRYNLSRAVGLGLGIIYRSSVFTGTDNTVVLPGYLRADAAAFFGITPKWGLQANVENVFNAGYYLFANGNNNITPGSPPALRLGLTARF